MLYVQIIAIARTLKEYISPGCQNVGEDGKAGKDYEGTLARTVSGKECQKWSEQKPHKHKYGHVGNHNYCRNPKGSGPKGIWCFTTSLASRRKWDFCDLPKCDIGMSRPAGIGFWPF